MTLTSTDRRILPRVIADANAAANRLIGADKTWPDRVPPDDVPELLKWLPRASGYNAAVSMSLAFMVVAAMTLLEWWFAGGTRNFGAIIAGGLIATLLYGNTNFAVGDLLMRPHIQRLRIAASARGLDPYEGASVNTWLRISSAAIPTILALLVASRLASSLHDSQLAQFAIITIGSSISVALIALQTLALREAAMDLGRAAAQLTTEETAKLITGSTDSHIVQMARLFNAAAERVDRSMQLSTARYEALFESAGDAILLVDPSSSRILEANRRAVELTGHDWNALASVAFENLFNPGNGYAGGQNGGADHHHKSIRILRADGSTCPVDIALSYVAVGERTILQAILHDVSARVEIEAQLRESVQRMEQLYHLAVTLGGTVDQIASYVATTLAELLDVPFVSIPRYVGDEIALLLMYDEGKMIRDGRLKIAGTPCAYTRNGREPYVTHTVKADFPDLDILAERGIETYIGVPIVAGTGEAIGCVAVMDRRRRDLSEKDMQLISAFAQRLARALDEEEYARSRNAFVHRLTEQNSELRRAQDRLTEADRLKSEFMGMMSHELRTPLNVFAGYSEMLLDMARDYPQMPLADQRDILGRMLRATAVLANLVEDTLSVLRLESAGVRVSKEPVVLRSLFDEIQATDRFLGDASRVAESWSAPVDLPIVSTDRLKLRQIITNLVGNARKFTKSGSIKVEAHSGLDSSVRLTVADTGCGISTDDLPHVFDLYRQVGNGESRDGCGLGLYIVRRYCDLLDARIDVESNLGQGTRFTVTLPTRDGKARSSGSANGHNAAPTAP
jgi:PAS domain S-box-containing protein